MLKALGKTSTQTYCYDMKEKDNYENLEVDGRLEVLET
jgi:hypothetical protein